MGYFFRKKVKAHQESDVFLVNAYKASGDPEYIGALYERYARLVFAVCMKYLKDEENAKDAVSRIFEKLFSDLKKYDVKQFNTWIHSVARNYCFSELQKEKDAAKVAIDNLPGEEIEEGSDDESTKYSDQELRNAIDALENHQKICIELFYLHKNRYSVIVDLTGFTLLQVKSYIQNGKRNLRKYLIGHHEEAKFK